MSLSNNHVIEKNRVPRLTGELVNEVISVLRHAHGWEVSQYDASFLGKSLEKRSAVTASTSVTAYLRRLAEDRTEAEVFLHSLSISFSEFFRNPLTFAILEQLILPTLVASKGESRPAELRIWSAGCAAGQEAWSVAMMLEDLATARARPIPLRIFATDVSEAALALAREGSYNTAAMQNVRLRHLRDYFSTSGESYSIVSRLRDRVVFSLYDLLDAHSACPPTSLYGDFDLILCCNLLFYYQPDIQQQVLDKVCRALAPGGYLVTGEAEKAIVAKHQDLRLVASPAAVFQKKNQLRMRDETDMKKLQPLPPCL
jgi:chemotaxis methyl-accepting protein methylase